MTEKKDPDFEGFEEEIEQSIELDNPPAKEKPALTYDSYQELEQKLMAAEEQVNKSREQTLRIQAELDNIRRRHERDLSSSAWIRRACSRLLFTCSSAAINFCSSS